MTTILSQPRTCTSHMHDKRYLAAPSKPGALHATFVILPWFDLTWVETDKARVRRLSFRFYFLHSYGWSDQLNSFKQASSHSYQARRFPFTKIKCRRPNLLHTQISSNLWTYSMIKVLCCYTFFPTIMSHQPLIQSEDDLGRNVDDVEKSLFHKEMNDSHMSDNISHWTRLKGCAFYLALSFCFGALASMIVVPQHQSGGDCEISPSQDNQWSMNSHIDPTRLSHAEVSNIVQKTELREAVTGLYTNVRFDGTFNRSSPYKGPPSPQVDALWHQVTGCELAFAVSKISYWPSSRGCNEHLRACLRAPERFKVRSQGAKRSRKRSIGHIWNDSPSSLCRKCTQGYMQRLRTDLSKASAVAGGLPRVLYWATKFQNQPSRRVVRAHRWATSAARSIAMSFAEQGYFVSDHCADMLRQKLMCDADTSIVTYNWVKGHSRPHPNFNVQHQCRDSETVLRFARDHQVDKDNDDRIDVDLLKPKLEPIMEFDGEPPYDPEAIPSQSQI